MPSAGVQQAERDSARQRRIAEAIYGALLQAINVRRVVDHALADLRFDIDRVEVKPSLRSATVYWARTGNKKAVGEPVSEPPQ